MFGVCVFCWGGICALFLYLFSNSCGNDTMCHCEELEMHLQTYPTFKNNPRMTDFCISLNTYGPTVGALNAESPKELFHKFKKGKLVTK